MERKQFLEPMGEIDFSEMDMKVKGMRIDFEFPIYPTWMKYKGEIYVSQLNFERTEQAGKPIFDLSYCMTKAINQCIMKTVQYDKGKFEETNDLN